MVERILFVCTANICRSPSAQATALHRLTAEGLADQITVVSAGTHAEAGRSWCADARKHVSTDPETRAIMGRHEARQVTRSRIGNAAIVVTADRQASAEVVRLDPSVRSRLFTMREAAALSQKVVEAARISVGSAAGDPALDVHPLGGFADPGAQLRWLVEEMDAARGQVSLLVERRQRHFLRSEQVPVLDVDIADAHVKSGRGPRHRRILPQLTGAVGQLMDGVTYVLGRPAP